MSPVSKGCKRKPGKTGRKGGRRTSAQASRLAVRPFEPEPGDSDERQATLAEVAPRKGDRLRYTYDFGDDWVHDILVEDIGPAEDLGRVVCLAGERAGPPEDCGGIPGYENLLDAMSDPDHPDRDHYLDWLGAPFDPTAVDLDAINAALAKVTVR